tara:strand:+ start:3615 stop:4604 length:990 start_codon:yes stop_codon:yes gene_type:complete
MSNFTVTVEENQRLLPSPVETHDVAIVNLPDNYMKVINEAVSAGKKFREGFDKINRKAINKEKKGGWFSSRYTQDDVWEYVTNNAIGYNIEQHGFNISRMLRFAGFLKGVDDELYSNLFSGFETGFIFASLVDNEINEETVHALHLIYNTMHIASGNVGAAAEFNVSNEEQHSRVNSKNLIDKMFYSLFYSMHSSLLKTLYFHTEYQMEKLVAGYKNGDFRTLGKNSLAVSFYLGVHSSDTIGYKGDKPFMSRFNFTTTGYCIDTMYFSETNHIMTETEIDEVNNLIGQNVDGYDYDENSPILTFFFNLGNVHSELKEQHNALMSVINV